MTRYRSISDIEDQAVALINQSKVRELPIDLMEIARYLGLNVEHTSFGDEISGVLVRTGDRGTIGINKDHGSSRQQFTIAHEIGHFLLHEDLDDLFIDKKYTAVFRDSKSSQGEHRAEIQANQFAAALLMPEQLVREAIDQLALDLGEEDSLTELAKIFGVSTQAMTYRLANLDIFRSKASDGTLTNRPTGRLTAPFLRFRSGRSPSSAG